MSLDYADISIGSIYEYDGSEYVAVGKEWNEVTDSTYVWCRHLHAGAYKTINAKYLSLGKPKPGDVVENDYNSNGRVVAVDGQWLWVMWPTSNSGDICHVDNVRKVR